MLIVLFYICILWSVPVEGMCEGCVLGFWCIRVVNRSHLAARKIIWKYEAKKYNI